MYLRTCGCFKSANHKKDWVQTANLLSSTFTEGPKIKQII
jgi:hypothetical protein